MHKIFEHPELHHATTLKNKLVISRVRLEQMGGHERLTVWYRGGGSGTLVVDAGDGEKIARNLFGDVIPVVREG